MSAQCPPSSVHEVACEHLGGAELSLTEVRTRAMCRGQTHTDRRRHPCTSPHTRGLANKVIPTLAPHRTGLTLAELRIGKGLFLCKIQNINSEFLEKSGNKDWGSEEVGNLANLQLKKGVSISLAIDLASVAKCHRPLVSQCHSLVSEEIFVLLLSVIRAVIRGQLTTD